jgi:hypothetical protein
MGHEGCGDSTGALRMHQVFVINIILLEAIGRFSSARITLACQNINAIFTLQGIFGNPIG